MLGKQHPLVGDSRWKARIKPVLEMRASVDMVPCAEGYPTTRRVWAWHNSCREIAISSARNYFRRELIASKRVGEKPWEVRWAAVYQPHFTPTIQLSAYWPMAAEEPRALAVLDLIVGLPLLLLAENPKLGGGTGNSSGGSLHWSKVSSDILHHPVLVSIALGLFRQALALIHNGFAPQVLEASDPERASQVLAESDIDEALVLAKSLKAWIQVPNTFTEQSCGDFGSAEDYFPFPWLPPRFKAASGWFRLLRLHQTIRKYGLQEVFGSFIHGWKLLDCAEAILHTGPLSFWGPLTAPNERHRRLRKLAASPGRGPHVAEAP